VKKTPTIFNRDPANMRFVMDEPSGSDVAWVFAGEGIATRKYDGTACLVKDGRLFKRYELRPGRTAPSGFEPAQEVDSNTGKQPGWMPVGDGPEDKYHRQAWSEREWPDGTYELVGPKIQGNKDVISKHTLIAHDAADVLPDLPRKFQDIKDFLSLNAYLEGIVWHHPDGRWAKIKRRDFGFKW